MSEYYTPLSPLQLLERDFPDITKSALIIDTERCYCGACNRTLTGYEVEDEDYCPNIDCGTGWVRALTTAPREDVPLYSFRIPVVSTVSVLERKYALARPDSLVRERRRRAIAHVVINTEYL